MNGANGDKFEPTGVTVPVAANTLAVGVMGLDLQDGKEIPRKRTLAWAFWDWATQPFNTVLLTFVWVPSYLTSTFFVDPAVIGTEGEEAALGQLASFLGYGVTVAGLLIARCAGEDKYFDVMHDIMASQKEWAAGVPPRTTLYRTAAAAGLSQEQTEACIRDKAAIEEMSNRMKAGIDAGVTGTPTFIVNGVKVLDSSLSGLSEAIDAELAK